MKFIRNRIFSLTGLCKIINISILFFNRMYVNCSGPGFALHSDIVMPYISHYGTKEQIEKFIPRMVAGTCIGAIAMTEPGAGRSVTILCYNVAPQLFEIHNTCTGHDMIVMVNNYTPPNEVSRDTMYRIMILTHPSVSQSVRQTCFFC